MSEHQTKSVTRTVTISDLQPSELASIFSQWNDKQQAEFFDCLCSEGEAFDGGSWAMQFAWMGDELSDRARALIFDMNDNVERPQ